MITAMTIAILCVFAGFCIVCWFIGNYHGFVRGWDHGERAGQRNGYESGKLDGLKEGHEKGLAEGSSINSEDARLALKSAYERGYINGYSGTKMLAREMLQRIKLSEDVTVKEDTSGINP